MATVKIERIGESRVVSRHMDSVTQQHYLSRRGNWLLVAQQGGTLAEMDTATVIQNHLDSKYPGEFTVTRHPKDMHQMYYEYTYAIDPTMYEKPELPTTNDVWRDPDTGDFMSMSKRTKKPTEALADGGGCIPDMKIQHNITGRRSFQEVKNQNDAGNAHERAAKYATPAVVEFIQKKFHLDYYPIGHIFTGPIVEDRGYCSELRTTFGATPNHLFLWKKGRPIEPMIEWLEAVILPDLRGTAAR